ncbi:NAD(P)H-hydrate dehydratase [Desulfovibrio legallii]|jgi:NAD(P)H-hydrate epimerase|uniref:Bifunctional NAD(P)H-hydrate repair enzyme n=1 Tax=Desulfovibrio legallii TaxID=571438 RepID=A0A1G7MY72_9BACT|nr:NAD(P)H-hydrate dehydratase [Desulfovibrio legallii]SDF66785.1 NAD(P)H-hydrate epimerase [Desulfovibrio legallii]
MTASALTLLPPLPLPDEVRAWDQGATALGLSGEILMENAARAAFDVLRAAVPRLEGREVWLLMGGGNNGGDAACLARQLLDAGARPLVLHTRPLRSYKGECGRHVRVARAAGVPFRPLRPGGQIWSAAPDLLVDGLLGTGFHGPLRPDMLGLIRAVNDRRAAFVLALDIPSGLDGVTGAPQPEAVRATATVTFAAAKPGLALPQARPWTGKVHVRPIGIPAVVRQAAPCAAYLLDGRCLAPLAALPANGFKNSFGHVLVAGGAPGYGGAAHLAARAALRAGAGLVTATAPEAALADIKNGWAEIMTLALPGPHGCWPETLPPAFAALAARCAALVVGPGLGRSPDAAAFLHALLSLPDRPPTVLDADALALLAAQPELLRLVRKDDALTPHPGEAGLLLGRPAAAVQKDRRAALRDLCALCRGVVALKGAGTLVGQAGAPVLLSPYDVPQLAAGGSGDVLAGCLGGLLAAHPVDAAWAAPLRPTQFTAGQAVALHALAGREAAQIWPLRGNVASATADLLPQALARYAAPQPPTGSALPMDKAAHSAPDAREDALAWPW